jgi:dTMP kinase
MFDGLMSIRNYYRRKDIDTLIMVRYLVGTAYLPKKLVKIGYKFFHGFVPTSKYMFFLDAEPEVVLKRFEERSEKEMFETLESLVKVRNKALSLVKDWYIIDSSRSIDETYLDIQKILTKLDQI